MDRQKRAKDYIIEALFKLMTKKDYRLITITDIANVAGVNRVTFYRLFDTKEDVIKDWINKVTDEFLEKSAISFTEDSLEKYFVKLFEHLEKFSKEALLIYEAGLVNLLKEKFEKVFFERHSEKYGSYKSYFIIGGIFNIYYYWLINKNPEAPEELASHLIDILSK